MREGLFYDIMVERPEGWNKELYNNLSYDFLIKCAKNGKIEEWNQAYRAYLQSEWERIFPDERYDPECFEKFLESDFVRPNFSDNFSDKDFKDAHLEGTYFVCAHLNKANFSRAYLQGSNFTDAHLEGACFVYAHLEDASFFMAHLEYTNFNAARLEDANFVDAYLEGAKFIQVVVNGGTHFNNSPIDDKTNFTGTSLSSARIFPELRTQLERNIRQIRWEQWYDKPKFYPCLAEIKNKLISKFSHKTSQKKKNWETKRCWVDRILNIFVRLFWLISNYGSSTKRIIFVFFGWNIFWAFIYYYLMPYVPGASTTVLNVSNIVAAILQTNLMMFSIADLATERLDILPMLLVTIHIVVGYFILAALITRLSIMFQNLSP